MKPLSNDENAQALDVLIANERAGLARLKYQIAVHRTILDSPAATVAELEASAIKVTRVIDFFEAERAKLVPAE